ncbi:S41 family peptidase [Bacillus sp. SCS-151]|uniref:S41 family peptidase n=1 Tax=Nanhaiella sioensis TaxID=3115293 RepID=UPI0039780719
MYYKIFNEIVSIMQHDYSGCVDKRGWDHPNNYLSKVKSLEEDSSLNPQQFVEIAKDYLIDFKDHHIKFRLLNSSEGKRYESGFKVRRYNDFLYITSVGKETSIEKGQRIISIDNISIPKLAKIHERNLKSPNPERQDWNAVINQYEYCELIDHEGVKKTVGLTKYEQTSYIPTYTIEKLQHRTLLMTITDFDNPEAITNLINEHAEEIANSENLLIDVRVNHGGSDTSFYSLLPYIFEDRVINLFDESEDDMYFHCTDRNYRLCIDSINNSIKMTKDPIALKSLTVLRDEWEKHQGKGVVKFDFSDLKQLAIFSGSKSPNKIIILTDVYCGSSGDSFVELCKKSSKVTVIGRPTAGVNDYSSLAVMKWNNLFELWYPTTRLTRIDQGRGMSGVGIKPDVYIPWTPLHIVEDIDLKEAQKILMKSSVH